MRQSGVRRIGAILVLEAHNKFGYCFWAIDSIGGEGNEQFPETVYKALLI